MKGCLNSLYLSLTGIISFQYVYRGKMLKKRTVNNNARLFYFYYF